MKIAIIGGGASGLVCAVSIMRKAEKLKKEVRVIMERMRLELENKKSN